MIYYFCLMCFLVYLDGFIFIMLFKKIFYYSIIVICFFIFLLHLFGPFAGPMSIINTIVDGFYDEEYLKNYMNIESGSNTKFINQIIGFVFWLTVLVCSSLSFLKRLSLDRKFSISFMCFLILSSIIFIPKICNIILH